MCLLRRRLVSYPAGVTAVTGSCCTLRRCLSRTQQRNSGRPLMIKKTRRTLRCCRLCGSAARDPAASRQPEDPPVAPEYWSCFWTATTTCRLPAMGARAAAGKSWVSAGHRDGCRTSDGTCALRRRAAEAFFSNKGRYMSAGAPPPHLLQLLDERLYLCVLQADKLLQFPNFGLENLRPKSLIHFQTGVHLPHCQKGHQNGHCTTNGVRADSGIARP